MSVDPSVKRLPVSIVLPDGNKLATFLEFPRADGYTVVKGPITYDADGMTTTHSVAWMSDPAFAEAYERGMATGHRFGDDLHIEWRVALACWAASVAIKLDGDFVECGVNTGIFSAAICSYVDFGTYADRRFYLVDTYEGIPTEQLSEAERAHRRAEQSRGVYFDSYELVCATFAPYPNVVPIKGRVPEILPAVPAERVAYLCIDMNAAAPERAAIEYFWDRIVPGGVVLLDDYGFVDHGEQRAAMDAFARAHDVRIFSMPTGHGLLIKPPG